LNLQLENKLALVSGSTAGIGLAIAKALAAEGACVIVNGRSEARVKEAIASIRANVPAAKLEGLALDLSKADAAAQTTKRHPDVDILVNNLGVYEVNDFEQITDAEWLTITRAPSVASALAMAKPIPAVEPLTSASLFSSWRFKVKLPVKVHAIH